MLIKIVVSKLSVICGLRVDLKEIRVTSINFAMCVPLSNKLRLSNSVDSIFCFINIQFN